MTGSGTSPVDALQAALAGEHAAVWGYGVVGARVDRRLRPLVRDAAAAHRARRDATTAEVRGRGGEPVLSAAAYDLPFPVTDRAAALRLALHLEEGAAAAWRYVVASTEEQALRRAAVAALTESAVLATRWRRRITPAAPTVPFPGAD